MTKLTAALHHYNPAKQLIQASPITACNLHCVYCVGCVLRSVYIIHASCSGFLSRHIMWPQSAGAWEWGAQAQRGPGPAPVCAQGKRSTRKSISSEPGPDFQVLLICVLQIHTWMCRLEPSKSPPSLDPRKQSIFCKISGRYQLCMNLHDWATALGLVSVLLPWSPVFFGNISCHGSG